jgi:hypothetical protein
MKTEKGYDVKEMVKTQFCTIPTWQVELFSNKHDKKQLQPTQWKSAWLSFAISLSRK